MQTRRLGGWWRLWITASAVWIAIIGGLAAYDYSNIPSAENALHDQIQWSCALGDPRSFNIGIEIPRPLSEYSAAELSRLVAETKPTDVNQEAWDALQKRVRSCIDAKNQDYNAIQQKKRSDLIFLASAFSTLPPTALLVLGALLGWVWRGFRQTK